jgi:hypothetical protein
VTEETKPARDPRDMARYTAAIVVIAAFIALAALAIAASRSSLSIGAPAGSRLPGASTGPPSESALLALVTSPTPAPPAAPPAPAPVATPAAAPAALPAPAPLPDVAAGKPCAALSLPAPQEVGGLQNLIRLVPLFGPFSPEAFAMLPAFEPGFHVLGPLFPLFETGLEQAAPVLDPLTVVVQQLGDAGFAVLGPLYAPYRQDVLDAEAQLAAYLQPIVQQLAATPGSECVIALEGVLASLVP